MDMERRERWLEPDDGELLEHLEHAHDFGEKKLAPAYKSAEEHGIFPQEIVSEMGRLGWFGFTIPEAYGGWGRNAVDTAYMMRTLAYWSPSVSLIWAAGSTLSASTIMLGGTEAQKQRLLPQLASGEMLGCFALTEPEAGSDARSLKTTAQKTENGWKLNGVKRYITNAANARLMTVAARTGPERGDISAFVLQSAEPGLKYPGLTVDFKHKWVFKGSDYCELVFHDVELPHNALLGTEGRGFEDVFLKTLEGGRINIAAQAIGMAMWIYDEAWEYVHLRRQFGKMLWDLPDVQARFKTAQSQLNLAWILVIFAAQDRDAGKDVRAQSAWVKIKATETAFSVATEMARHFGGVLSDVGCSMFQRVNNIMMTREYEGANHALRRVAQSYGQFE